MDEFEIFRACSYGSSHVTELIDSCDGAGMPPAIAADELLSVGRGMRGEGRRRSYRQHGDTRDTPCGGGRVRGDGGDERRREGEVGDVTDNSSHRYRRDNQLHSQV